MEAMMVKRGQGFFPATEHDREQTGSIPQDTVIRVKWSRARNSRFSAKFWVLAKLAWDHADPAVYPSVDSLVDALKIAVGHYETIVLLDGRIQLKPKSISFARMPEDEFAKFYSACCNALLETILAGVDYDDLEEMVLRFM